MIRIYAYIESLPRGERDKAKTALRTYVYGPGKMQPDDAIERYKERRARDAQRVRPPRRHRRCRTVGHWPHLLVRLPWLVV